MKLGSYDGRFPLRPTSPIEDAEVPQLQVESAAVDTKGVGEQLRSVVGPSTTVPGDTKTPEQQELVNNRSTLRWVSTAIMDFYDESGMEFPELLRLWNKKHPGLPVADFNGILVECSVCILKRCAEAEGAVAGAPPDRLRIVEEVHAMMQELTK